MTALGKRQRRFSVADRRRYPMMRGFHLPQRDKRPLMSKRSKHA